ncbi:MAG: potassium-transporting ATPase subunit KdpC [Myxococcales bacterium]|nr:potassium-transporting ATPase subunit KdpC [Myxococcales bacterium]
MNSIIRPAVTLLVAFTVLTGVLYPLLVTGLAQAAFPARANGSLIRDGERVVGSELIGQNFSGDGYFHGRPSATGPAPYNAMMSSGSNLGPTNPALAALLKERVAAIGQTRPVPVDLVTASGSGLDPHVSLAAALFQADRVTKARGMSRDTVVGLIHAHTSGRFLGIFGEARVNVLLLNLALDRTAQGGKLS